MQPLILPAGDWIGHIPFACALIETLKPKTIVELGTYSGSSFFAFCQAVKELGLDTKCYGIDMWEGDVHMGEFKDSVYNNVHDYKNEHYPSATFIRKFFDDAVAGFEDGSIDLLHIDGTHTYEAVSNDFVTWLPVAGVQERARNLPGGVEKPSEIQIEVAVSIGIEE